MGVPPCGLHKTILFFHLEESNIKHVFGLSFSRFHSRFPNVFICFSFSTGFWYLFCLRSNLRETATAIHSLGKKQLVLFVDEMHLISLHGAVVTFCTQTLARPVFHPTVTFFACATGCFVHVCKCLVLTSSHIFEDGQLCSWIAGTAARP